VCFARTVFSRDGQFFAEHSPKRRNAKHPFLSFVIHFDAYEFNVCSALRRRHTYIRSIHHARSECEYRLYLPDTRESFLGSWNKVQRRRSVDRTVVLRSCKTQPSFLAQRSVNDSPSSVPDDCGHGQTMASEVQSLNQTLVQRAFLASGRPMQQPKALLSCLICWPAVGWEFAAATCSSRKLPRIPGLAVRCRNRFASFFRSMTGEEKCRMNGITSRVNAGLSASIVASVKLVVRQCCVEWRGPGPRRNMRFSSIGLSGIHNCAYWSLVVVVS